MATFNLDANWTHWIRENIIRGSNDATIAGVLRDNFSISFAKANAIVQKVRQTPLPKSGTHSNSANDAVERREWMLKTLDKLQRLSSDYLHLDSIQAPPFDQFIQRYYAKNRPVLFNAAFAHWRAAQWTPETLLQEAGSQQVEVQTKRESNPSFEMDSLKHKQTMPFSEYFDLVMNTESSNDFYMTANNARQNQEVFSNLFKDLADIADGYLDVAQHPSRSFIWFGPKGNFTPLHHDQTNNLFMQVYGRKKVWLVPPLQTPYLYNDRAVFSPLDLRKLDLDTHPLASFVSPVEVTLGPGDTLFIPIGWWHQVESLDISISLTVTNFNVINSFT